MKTLLITGTDDGILVTLEDHMGSQNSSMHNDLAIAMQDRKIEIPQILS